MSPIASVPLPRTFQYVSSTTPPAKRQPRPTIAIGSARLRSYSSSWCCIRSIVRYARRRVDADACVSSGEVMSLTPFVICVGQFHSVPCVQLLEPGHEERLDLAVG